MNNLEDKAMKNVIRIMVDDAVNVYLSATVNLMHISEGTRHFKDPEKVKERCLEAVYDIETFFLSEYGEELTGVDGGLVLKTLNERAKKAYADVINGVPKARQRFSRTKFLHERSLR